MKILYITTIGIGMVFYKSLIGELVAEGNEVDVATNETTSAVPAFYRELGCRIYHIDTSRSPFSLGNVRAIRQIRELVQENGYDLVHCHTPLAAASTRFACKGLRKQGKVKVLYTAHGFHFYKGAPLKNWLLFYPIEKLCSRYTDVLITINQEDYELAKKKMKAKRVEYVPGVGIDVAKFANMVVDRKQKRAELGVPETAFMLLSVGELNKNKNHKVVIKALAQLKDVQCEHCEQSEDSRCAACAPCADVHYVIAGIGKERNSLLRLAARLGVKLHLLGFREDIAELDKVADCYVLPSIREGFNVSVMEAMASGLACVVSDIRGNRELIDEKGGFLCKATSSEAFAEAIRKVLEKKVQTEKVPVDKMLASGLEEYASYNPKKALAFDKAIINAQMKSIYESL